MVEGKIRSYGKVFTFYYKYDWKYLESLSRKVTRSNRCFKEIALVGRWRIKYREQGVK